MVSSRRASLAPVEHSARIILVLSGQKVLLDAVLAALYGVTTRRLNEQVRRNRTRFPQGLPRRAHCPGAHELEVAFCDIKSVRVVRA